MVAASSKASSSACCCVGREGMSEVGLQRTTKLFRTKPAAADRRPHKRHARPQSGGCAGVCPWRAKGQDEKSEGGRRQAVLDGDACTSRRGRAKPTPTTKPDTDAGTWRKAAPWCLRVGKGVGGGEGKGGECETSSVGDGMSGPTSWNKCASDGGWGEKGGLRGKGRGGGEGRGRVKRQRGGECGEGGAEKGTWTRRESCSAFV